MEQFGGGGGLEGTSNHRDLMQFGANPEEGGKFDASQYAFFGNEVLEEVELGGLEDEDEDIPSLGLGDEDFRLDLEECEAIGSLSEVDDLTNTFSRLNKVNSGPQNPRLIIDRGSRESSSGAEWGQDPNFPNWIDQRGFEYENAQDNNKKWSSNPYNNSIPDLDSNSIYRASSYPEQQNQHSQFTNTDPILIPNSNHNNNNFTSYPPPGGNTRASPNYPNLPYPPTIQHSSPNNLSSFTNPQLQLNNALPRGLQQFGGNLPQLNPINHRVQNQWLDRPMMPHQQQIMMPPQQRIQPQFRPPFSHLSGMHNRQLSPPMMNNFGDLRDPRSRPMIRGGPNGPNGPRFQYPRHDFDMNGQRMNQNGWPRFKSKCMTSYEIENIMKMQIAATHTNDPYVDDYYHQACLAKKNSGTRPFSPIRLSDGSSRINPNSEPHPFLQVDALGRVSFASVRRPRPLLEVEPSNSSGPGNNSDNNMMSEKPLGLGQEPMLAARVIIEDGLCLLLDVDDIDRFFEFNQLQDGGTQLRHRRQVLLEGLASSLQLVDPLGKTGQTVELAHKDDLLFLRLISLPKGKKLLSKYLRLVTPGNELIRVVCMAIFRNLRFMFRNVPSDPSDIETTSKLTKTVTYCIESMDLKALGACLASVVCSIDHPPLRPIGSPAGDGASILLKAILDRATELFRDPHGSNNCTMPNRAFWQASFDAFFGLLTKYCFSKYDSVMAGLMIQDIGAEASRAISREMPVELLRASLPHTNEQQRKLLLDFAHRSMPQGGAGGGNTGGM